MNLLLLHPTDLERGGTTACVRGRRLRHAFEVLKVAPGKELEVGLLGGRLGRGLVVEVDDEALRLELRLERDPPPPLPLTVILALPRPKVLRRVVAALASLGVAKLVLVNASRVEKSYWQSPFLATEVLEEAWCLGLEQAGDTRPPAIESRRLWRPFVEDELPQVAAGSRGLVAHPNATTPCPRAVPGPITLAVGPEGGFSPFEVALLEAVGFLPVACGLRILRVETVLPLLVGRLF